MATLQEQIVDTNKAIKALQDKFTEADRAFANANANIANDSNQIAQAGKRPSIAGQKRKIWDDQHKILVNDLAINQAAAGFQANLKNTIQTDINNLTVILGNLNKAVNAIIVAAPGEASIQAEANAKIESNKAAADLAKISGETSNKKYWIIGGVIVIVIIAIVVVIYIRK